VQSVRCWFSWRIEKTRCHLIGDEYFFNSLDESGLLNLIDPSQ